MAWAAKLDKSKRVVVAYFGDGASNIGAFHEALNLASLWKLPVMFVCPNNGFAEHTRYENATSVDKISTRAVAYRCRATPSTATIRSRCIAHVHAAIERARAGEGPTLLECKTFRFLGHVLGDDDFYMTKEEKAAAMAADPLPAFRARLIAEGHASEDAARRKMQADIEAEIADAQEFGMNSPMPIGGRTAPRCLCRGDAGMSEMLQMNGIQAINAAMFEAMEADPKVLVLGEDIADREGGGVTGTMKGLSTKFGDRPGPHHADLRTGDHRRGNRRGDGRLQAGCRDHADELHHGRDGHDLQPRGQAAVHVGRADPGADGDPHPDRRGLADRRAALRSSGRLVRPCRRDQGRRARRTRRT